MTIFSKMEVAAGSCSKQAEVVTCSNMEEEEMAMVGVVNYSNMEEVEVKVAAAICKCMEEEEKVMAGEEIYSNKEEGVMVMEEVEIDSNMVVEETVMVVVGTCSNKVEVVESCKYMEEAVNHNSNLEVVMEKVVVKTYQNMKVQVQVQPMTEEMVPVNNNMETEPILKVRVVNCYQMEMAIVVIDLVNLELSCRGK